MSSIRSVPPQSGSAEGSPAEAERVVLWARVLFGAPEPPPSGRRSRPPKVDVTASFSGVVRSIEARLRAGGGAVEAQLSGQLVASFPAADALDAIELGLELLEEADGYELAIALSLSMTWVDAGVRVGSAFDDSFFLAGRAKSGELLVDGALRDRVPGHYLFTRQVSSGGLRAGSVDRRHPRRAECVRSLALLGAPPLAAATAELVAPVVEALRAEDAFVVLEGPIGAGASELIAAVGRELGGPPALWVGAAAGTLVPLESLRRAVTADPRARELLSRAEPPPLGELVHALDALLPPDRFAWIVLNPLAAVDVASLEALAALRAARPGRLAILSRAPVDASIAPPLGAPTARFTLPVLRTADARAVVRALLGPGTADDVVRRVATMGGDTTLGCEEAARLLLASGELVREGEAFVWRTAPRSGAEAVGVEELARARTELVPVEARRALEIVAVAPPSASRELIRSVAAADGVGPRELDQSLAVLASEGWLAARDEPTAHFFRRSVQTSMPPARLAELHRFVLDALATDGPERLARAFFAVEGDREIAAREEAKRIGEALRGSGFEHSAARFVGAPRSVLPREAAISVPPEHAPHASRAPAPPSAPYAAVDVRSSPHAIELDLAGAELDEQSGPDPRALREALRARDVPALERWVEQATLAGEDLTALARLRAVIDLMRGDFANAEARLARSSAEVGPRALLAQAMVTLGAGRPADAVRFSLRALALSLRREDERGRGASLHALAACYRAEGRAADADQLAARAARGARA